MPVNKESLVTEDAIPNPKSWAQATKGTRAKNVGPIPDRLPTKERDRHVTNGAPEIRAPPMKKARNAVTAPLIPEPQESRARAPPAGPKTAPTETASLQQRVDVLTAQMARIEAMLRNFQAPPPTPVQPAGGGTHERSHQEGDRDVDMQPHQSAPRRERTPPRGGDS